MMERLLARGEALGASRGARVIDRLADEAKLPKGVRVERLAHGLVLIGRRLKFRIVTNGKLRAALTLANRLLP